MSIGDFSRTINRPNGRKSCRKAARRCRELGRRALSIEPLEIRCLLSASLGLSHASDTAAGKNLTGNTVMAGAITTTAGGRTIRGQPMRLG